MPTGYTAGIENGTINTFKEFAQKCTRAFIVHMRDEPWDAPYKPRTSSGYHEDCLKEAEKQLEEFKTLSDEVIIARIEKETAEDIARYKENIKKGKDFKTKLEKMLVEANAYKSPTVKHGNIRNFMIDQLESTIDHDGDVSFYEGEVAKAEAEAKKGINIEVARADIKAKIHKDIAYHTKEIAEEKARIIDHNQWYEDFMNSISDSVEDEGA